MPPRRPASQPHDAGALEVFDGRLGLVVGNSTLRLKLLPDSRHPVGVPLLLLLACDPSAGDTGDAGETGNDENLDSASPEWVALPAECVAPTELGEDPLNLVGQVRVTQEGRAGFLEALDVEVADDIAYVVGMGRLVIADVSDRTAPVKLSGPSDTSLGKLHRVEPFGEGYLATTQREEGLLLWDVSDPTLQVELTRVGAAGMEGLAYAEDRLFVGVRNEGVRVYDVVDPAAPVETGRAAGLGATWELAATGDGWLYAADATLGLVPIDVQSPDAPEIGTPVPVELSAPLHVRYADDRVYVSVGAAGVDVFDVSDRASPLWVGNFAVTGSAVMSAVANGRLWVADHEAVTVFDLATGLPIHRDEVEQYALAVWAEGDVGFVGDWNLIDAWELSPGVAAPSLDGPPELRLREGVATTVITNQGGAELQLLGAAAGDGVVEASALRLRPGESATLRVSGGEDGGTLCLASNDPDSPLLSIPIRASAAAPAGLPAPDFTLTSIDGESYRLSEHLGRPVFLVFFGTW